MTVLDEAPTRNGSAPEMPSVAEPRSVREVVAVADASRAELAEPASAVVPEAQQRRRWWGLRRSERKQLDEVDRAIVTAERFFWAWLVLATTVSLTANFSHSWMTAPESVRIQASIFSLCPPIFLLGMTHHGALLVKARRFGWDFAASMLLTILLAAFSFLLSYEAIRDLVIMFGTPSHRAGLWPIVNDLSIVNSTLGLFTISRKRKQKAESTGNAARPGWLARLVGRVDVSAFGNLLDGAPMTEPERELWWARVAAVVKSRHADVKQIADRTEAEIAEVLRLTFDEGERQRAIERAVPGITHHRVVRAIQQAGAQVLQRTIPAAE